MFRIGVSSDKKTRQKERRKSFASSLAAGATPGAKSGDRGASSFAPDMTPLTDAMRRMSTDASGATTPAQPRRARRRASRPPKEGKWISVPPKVPHCKDRPESPLEQQPVQFSIGKCENKATRRRCHSFASYRIPAHCSEDCFPTYGLYRERVLNSVMGAKQKSPSSPCASQKQSSAALLREATSSAESLKARGNDAMQNGDYAKAREFYSEGLELVIDHCSHCKQLVSKLLSNRAAALICQLDLDAALQDCAEARRIYPKNLRAYIRSASCHTARGEFNEAQAVLEHALEMLSASDSHFKTIKDQINQIQRLRGNYDDVAMRCATGEVDEALCSVMDELCDYAKHCEKVWRLAILLHLQSGNFVKLEKTMQRARDLFKLTLESSAEQFCWWRWIRVEATWWDPTQSVDSLIRDLTALLDCMRMHSMKSLDTTPMREQVSKESLESRLELLRSAAALKDEGNQAIGHKNYEAAADRYSQAIALCERSGSPKSFLSVLYCNRGAAMQGLGRYLEALSDAVIALSLNPSYAKAYLRVAQLYIESRNNAAAAEALKSLQAIQERHQLSSTDAESLRLLQQRTSSRLENAQEVDAYKLLGLSRKCQTADVKKAFRKLALKLHPDKVSHSVKLPLTSWMHTTAPTASFIESNVQQIRNRLRDHMQHLFKYLNSANIVLSDPEQRRKLDGALQRHDREDLSRGSAFSTSSKRRQQTDCHRYRNSSSYNHHHHHHYHNNFNN